MQLSSAWAQVGPPDDTFDQAASARLQAELGITVADDAGNAPIMSMLASFGLPAVVRGLRFEFGVSVAYHPEADDVYVSVPLFLRYDLILPSAFSMYARVGLAYFARIRSNEVHGLHLSRAGLGAIYYVAPTLGLGLGLDYHGVEYPLTLDVPLSPGFLELGVRLVLVL